ncbi:hypothetical protein [Marinobacter similis]|uniref:hypothetical protein n=1 Tax=Marinobacter similis TaxID=1420916 RepID=UPI0011DD0CE6|nr:hypothetical protein [Marinobacter similis]
MVALIIMALLWWWVLGALDRRAGSVEQVAVDSELSQLRAAVLIKSAEAMLERPQGFYARVGGNPFEWLKQEWRRYQGGCDGSYPPVGHWCFWVSVQKETINHPKGWLIYRPNRPITLAGRQFGPVAPAAWRVTVEHVGVPNDASRNSGRRAGGLLLEMVNPDTGEPVLQAQR